MFGGFFANIQSGAAFNPLDYSPLLWLDARVGITESSGAVSNWADQSGNGNDFTQITASRQPSYSSTMFNGTHDGLDFASDYLESDTLSSSLGECTIFIVFYYDAYSNGDSLMGSTSGANNKRPYITSGYINYWDGGTDGNGTSIDPPDYFSNPSIVAIREASGGTYDQKVNDLAWISPITITSVTDNTSPLVIGNRGAGSNRYFNGKMAQVLIYDSLLTQSDSEKVINYFNDIYTFY